MKAARAAWLLALAALLASAPWRASAQTLKWSEEFLPTSAAGYVNGGIDTSLWSFHLGDGSDFGIPSEFRAPSGCTGRGANTRAPARSQRGAAR
jgi:hypothetical protein